MFCTHCNTDKDIHEFAIGRRKCIDCRNTEQRDRRRTREGLIKAMYASQKRTSKKRGHPQPLYNLEELLEWAFKNNDFEVLYKEWERSNFDVLKKPSIDRVDDSIGYSFENITIMTWEENNKKSHTYISKAREARHRKTS